MLMASNCADFVFAVDVVDNAPRMDENSPARIMFFCDGGLRLGGRCSSPEVLLSPKPRLEMRPRTPPDLRKL